jgi:hypothetical protein
MKRQAYGIARVRNNGAIQSYLDAFSMRDQIKHEKYVEFVYRAMRERFWDLQYELRMSTGWDDFSFVPLPMQN